jgi:hypothetical protein
VDELESHENYEHITDLVDECYEEVLSHHGYLFEASNTDYREHAEYVADAAVRSLANIESLKDLKTELDHQIRILNIRPSITERVQDLEEFLQITDLYWPAPTVHNCEQQENTLLQLPGKNPDTATEPETATITALRDNYDKLEKISELYSYTEAGLKLGNLNLEVKI